MEVHQKRIVIYLGFIALGGVCVYLSGLVAGFSAYQHGNGPPTGTRSILQHIILGQSRYVEIKAFLLHENQGKLITEEEYVAFTRFQPRAEQDVGDSRGSNLVLCFATKTWAYRVFFDENGIAIAYELRW